MRTLLAASLVCISCVSDSERAACSPDASADITVSGFFKEGKGSLPASSPPSTPFRTVATVNTNIGLSQVTIGGTPATLRSGTTSDWEALQSAADLERNRDGGVAVLTIMAVDQCGLTYSLSDVAVVPLGAAPGIAISGLALVPEFAPANECALAANGSTPLLLRVTASAESVGGTVRLDTSQGSFSGGTASTVTLTLAGAGARSEQTTYFVPPRMSGTALLTASASGSPSVSKAIPIVGAPVFTAPTSSLKRGLDYFATVRTAGNLSTCGIEETIGSIATVSVDDPPLGPINGTLSVAKSPILCGVPEAIRLKVRFAPTAPDGGAVTVRCTDTLLQESAQTFVVDPVVAAVPVTNPALEILFSPAGECSIPSNASVPLLVRVTASPVSAGGAVRLEATQGSFSGGTASGKDLVLALSPDGGQAEQLAWFVPSAAGTAVLSASASGTAIAPKVVTVVAAPTPSATTMLAKRDRETFASMTTTGNMSTCVAEESILGISVVTVVEPPAGAINGSLSVAQNPITCDGPEMVRFKVRFLPTAPDGGTVRVRCRDSFQQEASTLFQVDSTP